MDRAKIVFAALALMPDLPPNYKEAKAALLFALELLDYAFAEDRDDPEREEDPPF